MPGLKESILKFPDILAIYAACLSTIVFIWNVSRTIPRIKVRLTFGMDEIDGEYKHGVYVSVQNPSSKVVHLSNILILYPYKNTIFFDLIRHAFKYRRIPFNESWVPSSLSLYGFDDKLPVSLDPGKSHNFLIPQDVVDEILKNSVRHELKAVVQDQLWRNRYSRTFKVN